MIGTLAARAWCDRLERLGHDPVVGRDDDHRDVGHPGAAGTHRGERLVTRRVEEDDAAAVLDDLAGADVLGDAAPLAGRDLGRPDRVEQARLAVVDVAHDGHDRGAWLEQRRIVLLEQDFLGGGLGDRLLAGSASRRRWSRNGRRLGDLVAELAGDERRRVTVDQLVDGREDAALDQLADHVRGVDVEQLGELLDGDRRRQLDRATLARVERPGRRRRECAVSRRGGLRGPRRPRVPLLLLATAFLLRCVSGRGAARRRARYSGRRRAPGSRAPLFRCSIECSRRQCRRADVRAPPGQPAARSSTTCRRRASGRSGRAPAWAGSSDRRRRSGSGPARASGATGAALRRHLPGRLRRRGLAAPTTPPASAAALASFGDAAAGLATASVGRLGGRLGRSLGSGFGCGRLGR